VTILLNQRETELEKEKEEKFAKENGLGLVWLAPWPEDEQLHLDQLDIWFIEICRRVRLIEKDGSIFAVKGASKATRIDAKVFKGSLGDPYAPIHKAENKSLTLGEGDFDYRRLTDLLFSGDWDLPLLARPAAFEPQSAHFALVCAALSRGNSKTDGFKSRVVPIRNQAAQIFGARREQIHGLAKAQIEEIGDFAKAIRYGLALAASGGDGDKIKKEHYALTHSAQAQFDRAADALFFPHLWRRFAAQDGDEEARVAERRAFQSELHVSAARIFNAALPNMPCAGIFRPRAEARAQAAFHAMIRKSFPLLFETDNSEVRAHAS
jgi:CRISPR system Cascade subunit CasA